MVICHELKIYNGEVSVCLFSNGSRMFQQHKEQHGIQRGHALNQRSEFHFWPSHSLAEQPYPMTSPL